MGTARGIHIRKISRKGWGTGGASTLRSVGQRKSQGVRRGAIHA